MSLGDLSSMMNKAKQMQENIKNLKVEGQSGAGLIKLNMSGRYEVDQIEIDPSLLDPNQKEILEDLVRAAFNNAVANMEEQMKAQMQSLTGGLNLPAGFKMPF